MHKKGHKKTSSLRRNLNFNFTLPRFENVEGGKDDGEDQDPEVVALTRRIETEGFDAILKELEQSFAQLGKHSEN